MGLFWACVFLGLTNYPVVAPYLRLEKMQSKTTFSLSGKISVKKEAEGSDLSNTVVYLTPKNIKIPSKDPIPPIRVSLSHDVDKMAAAPFHVCLRSDQKLEIVWPESIFYSIRAYGNKTVVPRHHLAGLHGTTEDFAESDEGIIIGCQLEKKIFGYVTVVSTPYFTNAVKDGMFSLPATIPAGNYVLTAYHPVYGRVEKEVRIGCHENESQITLQLERCDRPSIDWDQP